MDRADKISVNIMDIIATILGIINQRYSRLGLNQCWIAGLGNFKAAPAPAIPALQTASLESLGPARRPVTP
jgi:hypothetical protein